MNRISKISAVALLVIGALLAVWALFSSQKITSPSVPVSASSGTGTPQVEAVVAARHLPAGHWVTPEDVTMKNFAQMPSDGVAVASLVVGRTTAVEIAQDSAVQASSLLEGIAGLLAEGERAVSIKVDESSAVGHKLKPGDWVDVFVVLRRDGQEVESTQARMLMPRKKIMAYGEKIQGELKEDGSKNKDAQTATARTAVIAVPVQEVNRLLLAEQQGLLLLALRSPLDQNEPSADMLKQIPGLNVLPAANQDVSHETAALNASLHALKMSDLGGDVGNVLSRAPGKQLQVRAANRTLNTPTPNGAVVEIVRGKNKETIRY